MNELMILKKKLSDIIEQYNIVSEKLKPLQNKQEELQNTMKSLYEEIDSLEYHDILMNINNNLPLTQKEIELIVMSEHRSKIQFDIMKKLLNKKFSLRREGYFSETMQTAFTFSLVKNNSELTNKVRRDIEYILPHLKPITIERLKAKDSYENELDNTGIRFTISESTLAEYGIWYLFITPNNFHIVLTKFGRSKIEQTFSSLSIAMQYIQNNLWYECLENDGQMINEHSSEAIIT